MLFRTLKEDKIYLRNPLEFNDPYDCAFRIKNFFMTDEMMKRFLKNNPDGFREAHNITKKQLTKLQKSDKIIRDVSRYAAKNDNLKYKDEPKKLREIINKMSE